MLKIDEAIEMEKRVSLAYDKVKYRFNEPQQNTIEYHLAILREYIALEKTTPANVDDEAHIVFRMLDINEELDTKVFNFVLKEYLAFENAPPINLKDLVSLFSFDCLLRVIDSETEEELWNMEKFNESKIKGFDHFSIYDVVRIEADDGALILKVKAK